MRAISMFNGTPFQVFVQATVFAGFMCVGKAVLDWHQVSAAPWNTIGGAALGVYTFAAIVVVWRFIGTRYLDRK